MTEDNKHPAPVARPAGEAYLKLDTVARALWQDESLRVMGKKRGSEWENEAPDVREKWHYRARFALAATPSSSLSCVPASPSGSGEELCEDEGCPHFGTPHVCITRVVSAPTAATSGRGLGTELEQLRAENKKLHEQLQAAREAQKFIDET